MTNGRLALARLALGPFKVGLAHAPALPAPRPGTAPRDAITSLATEWLQRLWELPTSDRKPTRRA
jgi:hypothetical protein